ncbi:MAG: MerR family transcriptional regulator [Dysgonamonadaceae bacterium]|jgi:DNA-binding transcriptional MerR regulator|nr:MerR family transcriptional regulator [Dysgonamonadaceae bacterium]
MPAIQFKQEKIFYSIREVADLFGVNQSLLRYWEKEFPSIRPVKTEKGTRQYRKEDVDEIRLVHYLVKEKGMTLPGAKQKLKENRDKVVRTEEIIDRLKNVRAELMKLKTEFDELEEEYEEAVNGVARNRG